VAPAVPPGFPHRCYSGGRTKIANTFSGQYRFLERQAGHLRAYLVVPLCMASLQGLQLRIAVEVGKP